MVPDEVSREIERLDDSLHRWIRSHPVIVRPFAVDAEPFLVRVLREFPQILDPNKPLYDADPHVVALALQEQQRQRSTLFECEVVVVCHERTGLPLTRKSNIPNACKHFGIPVINMVELIKAEGWVFT
jgi:hypothetical protein